MAMAIRILDKSEVVDDNTGRECLVLTYHDGANYFVSKSYNHSLSDLDTRNIDVRDFQSTLIPLAHIFPPLTPNMCVAKPTEINDEHDYIKVPRLVGYNPDQVDTIPLRFLCEVNVHEILRKDPHPNIVKYKGCVVNKDNDIIGMCLERCNQTLMMRIASSTIGGNKHLDPKDVTESLESAVSHLHGLGFCHNDITLANIMVRSDDSVVLIDFDRCQPIGESLRESTTPRFTDQTATESRPQNDFYSIQKILDFMKIAMNSHSMPSML